MPSSKYAKLSTGDATSYNSIFTYSSAGRQSWSKKTGADGVDYLRGEDEEWKNTDNFCEIAGNIGIIRVHTLFFFVNYV